MNAEQSLFQFIDFYLASSVSQKNIELIKIKIDANSKRIEDPLLREVSLIKATLKALRPHSKLRPESRFNRHSHQDRLINEIHQLKLDDALILTSGELFPIPADHLSLALRIAAESILFRRTQLLEKFKEDGLTLSELKLPIRVPEAPQAGESFQTTDKISMVRRFQRLPMAARFLIETGLVLLGLLALLWIIPEIRNRYETSIQKRINDYLIESSLVDSPAPNGTSKTPVINPEAQTPAATDDEEENTAQKSSSEEVSSRKQPKVNEGETWRFSFTGSDTPDIETSVNSALQKLNVDDKKPTTVPGGIQYDFILPVGNVLSLKSMLEQSVAEIQQRGGSKGSISNLANFSWYKKQRMNTRKVPPGNVQIIIWISTL